MKRVDIMANCPDEFVDELKDIVDYMEQQFNDIRDLLQVEDVSDMGNIEIAYDKANCICSDLY